jgi:ribosome-associated protein
MERNKDIVVGPVRIPATALAWQFARSSGPGGQHVNRTSSKAVLRFPLIGSPHLPADVRQRLVQRERGRLTADGEIVISSQRHRDQSRNVADCLEKLVAMLERALVVPKTRRGTKTPRAAPAKRLEQKQRRSAVKRMRGRVED